jgi:hypothetical protein
VIVGTVFRLLEHDLLSAQAMMGELKHKHVHLFMSSRSTNVCPEDHPLRKTAQTPSARSPSLIRAALFRRANENFWRMVSLATWIGPGQPIVNRDQLFPFHICRNRPQESGNAATHLRSDHGIGLALHCRADRRRIVWIEARTHRAALDELSRFWEVGREHGNARRQILEYFIGERVAEVFAEIRKRPNARVRPGRSGDDVA